MNDATMEEAEPSPNVNDGDSNLDFCTGDDFLTISHSAALVSPSSTEFDLIVKVKYQISVIFRAELQKCFYSFRIILAGSCYPYILCREYKV